MTRHLSLLAAVCLLGAIAHAQDNAALLDRLKAMEDRIKALEAEVTELKGQKATPEPAPAAAAAAVAPSGAPNTSAASQAAASKVFNPDIAVIGDFIGTGGHNPVVSSPALEMHESEVAFQAILDPYARADFFISFGEQGVTLEEGFLTFTSLPAGLQLKVGKMRAAFGKVNTLHNHVLPWIDRPLVTQDLVGGEDGIDDAGLSLSRILPAPKGLFLEATAQIYRGDSDNVFHARRRDDVATVGHLRAYRDLSESTNIDIGGSYARGHSPFGNGTNQLWGTDLTLRWKPLRRAIYHSFVGRSEFIWARTAQDQYNGAFPGLLPQPAFLVRPFGYYVSAEYQLGRRWFAGARFDRSERGNCLPTEPPTTTLCNVPPAPGQPLLRDTGGSLVLTYWPSEFSQIRGQLRHTHYGEGLTANEFIFQFMFSMGAHGAHPF